MYEAIKLVLVDEILQSKCCRYSRQ